MGEQRSLDFSSFILRGCCLKNTKYIWGFVAYTGHETKIMLNTFKTKRKMSTVEKMMNKQILFIFYVQVFKKLNFFESIFFVILDCSLHALFNNLLNIL